MRHINITPPPGRPHGRTPAHPPAIMIAIPRIGISSLGVKKAKTDKNTQKFGKIIKKVAPNASFIPEVWQGHHNQGEGFWIALDKLEKWLSY